jgi:hypothetical protein
MAFGCQPLHHLPAAIERRPGILLIQQPHQQQVLRALAHRLVVQAGAVDAQQLALSPHTDLRVAPIHQRPHLVNRACRLFLSQSSSTFSRPISSYSASLSLSPLPPLRVLPSTKSSGNCSRADFRHFAIWIECTLNSDPNWLSVFSPRIASTATRALDFGLYCFLVVVIDLSLSTTPPKS